MVPKSQRYVQAAVIGFALAPMAVPLAAQESGRLQILSPSRGAVVKPGQTVMVQVRGPGEYKALAALGEIGGGLVNSPVGSPPWMVPIQIP